MRKNLLDGDDSLTLALTVHPALRIPIESSYVIFGMQITLRGTGGNSGAGSSAGKVGRSGGDGRFGSGVRGCWGFMGLGG